MASLVIVTAANPQGAEVLQACAQIRDGIAKLQKIDGQRLQAIGASVNEFETRFGVTAGGGQALSDRIGAFLNFVENGTEAPILNDLIDATFKA